MNTSNSTSKTTPSAPRFSLGDVYNTPGAQEIMQRYQINPLQLIGRHVTGDWGDLCTEDAQANEDALQFGSRILSSYVLTPATGEHLPPARIWLITEADRSVTTLLLPEEY